MVLRCVSRTRATETRSEDRYKYLTIMPSAPLSPSRLLPPLHLNLIILGLPIFLSWSKIGDPSSVHNDCSSLLALCLPVDALSTTCDHLLARKGYSIIPPRCDQTCSDIATQSCPSNGVFKSNNLVQIRDFHREDNLTILYEVMDISLREIGALGPDSWKTVEVATICSEVSDRLQVGQDLFANDRKAVERIFRPP
jgi:hypothetical protein